MIETTEIYAVMLILVTSAILGTVLGVVIRLILEKIKRNKETQVKKESQELFLRKGYEESHEDSWPKFVGDSWEEATYKLGKEYRLKLKVHLKNSPQNQSVVEGLLYSFDSEHRDIILHSQKIFELENKQQIIRGLVGLPKKAYPGHEPTKDSSLWYTLLEDKEYL